jgi:hypothetical protein
LKEAARFDFATDAVGGGEVKGMELATQLSCSAHKDLYVDGVACAVGIENCISPTTRATHPTFTIADLRLRFLD